MFLLSLLVPWIIKTAWTCCQHPTHDHKMASDGLCMEMNQYPDWSIWANGLILTLIHAHMYPQYSVSRGYRIYGHVALGQNRLGKIPSMEKGGAEQSILSGCSFPQLWCWTVIVMSFDVASGLYFWLDPTDFDRPQGALHRATCQDYFEGSKQNRGLVTSMTHGSHTP